MTRPEPTGHALTFEPGELFFSTTDNAGRIDGANDVFVRLSGYTREELQDAPHNIVRHPGMPQGVYRLLWDSIQGGVPFAGYIRNLSADGSHYDVFATVTPLPSGGYLSVRSLPLGADSARDMWAAYEEIVRAEEKAREEGATARESAGVGAELVEQAVKSLGYPSYEAFQRKALLREVMLREEALEGTLGLVVTNTIDLIVRAALGVHAEVSVLSVDQEDLETLTRYIDTVITRIRRGVDLQAAAELGLWDSSDTALRGHIDSLHEELARLGELSRTTQFHISLSRLQAAMVTQFADERFDIEGEEPRQRAHRAIRQLVEALVEDIDKMLASISELHAAIARARISIDTVITAMRGRRTLIDRFLDESFETGADLTAKAEAMEPAFSDSIIETDDALSSLTTLKASLEDFDADYDSEPLREMRRHLLESIESTEV